MSFFHEVLHILAKDARRLRFGIYGWITFIAVAAIAFQNTLEYGSIPSSWVDTFTAILVIYSWALTCLAVLQEPLVSDKSFWLTRPYRRSALLVSKLLFIATALLLPIALMQVSNVHQAGLPVLRNAPLLLANSAGFGICTLFFFASAAVAPRFVSSIFYVFGLVLYIACGAALYGMLNHNFDPSFAGNFPAIFLVLVCVAVIAIQYFSRRTYFARALAIATVLTTTLLTIIPMPAVGAYLAYPAGAADARTFGMDFDRDETLKHPGGSIPDGDEVNIRLPISVFIASMDADQFNLEGRRLQLHTPDGQNFDTGWTKSSSDTLKPGADTLSAVISVPRPFFLEHAAQPVTFSIDYAIQHAQLGQPHTYPLSQTPSEVEGLGSCAVKVETEQNNYIQCFRAFKDLRASEISGRLSSRPCEEGAAAAGPLAFSTLGSDRGEAWPFSFTGVNRDTAKLHAPVDLRYEKPPMAYLCPGIPITVRHRTAQPSFSTRISGSILLKDYIAKVQRVTEKD